MTNSSSKNILRVAAAGAGKTYRICSEAINEAEAPGDSKNCYGNVLLTSYANKAELSIDEELRKQCNGIIPSHIEVMSWYSFLINEMIKPYQSNMYDIFSLNGLYFNPHSSPNWHRKGEPQRYATQNGDIVSEQAAELAIELNRLSNGAVIHRLENIFTHIFIDEAQDLNGYDIDIVELLLNSKISVTLVGDGKQAIFKTNYSSKM